MADILPPWLARWFCSLDTGISSFTVAAALCDVPAIRQIQRGPAAPRDPADIGRCVRLLDLAAKNGEDWRARLPEVADWCPAWAPLAPRWAEVEAAYHEDVVAQEAHRRAIYLSPTGRRLTRPRKDIPFPPGEPAGMGRARRRGPLDTRRAGGASRGVGEDSRGRGEGAGLMVTIRDINGNPVTLDEAVHAMTEHLDTDEERENGHSVECDCDECDAIMRAADAPKETK